MWINIFCVRIGSNERQGQLNLPLKPFIQRWMSNLLGNSGQVIPSPIVGLIILTLFLKFGLGYQANIISVAGEFISLKIC
jgi:hypothetical protein